MSDAAEPYVLPALDPELEALLVRTSDDADADEVDAVAVGAIIQGIVEELGDDYVRLSAGGERLLCPLVDARDLEGKLPAVGERIDALVEELRHDGAYRASIDKARQLTSFERLREIANTPDVIEGTITLARRNGFSVDCDGVRGSVSFEDAGVRRDEAHDLVGKRLTFQIRGLDENEAQLLLTRKAFAQEERAQNFEAAVASLEVGQLVEGVISRTAAFGAFVRIDGIQGVEGLLHISEMDLERVDAQRLPVAIGDRVQLRVVEIQPDRQRIGLSRRALLVDTMREKLQALVPNSIVEGTVAGLTDFGAFIETDDGIRGLCHISELSWTERDRKPDELLSIGQRVQVRVLQVDSENLRVALSIRQAADNPWSRFVEAHPIGSQITGTIREIKERGLVVALPDNLEGFVRLADLSWTIRAESPADVRAFEVGEELTVALLAVDSQRQRIVLGLKQTEPDPWDLAGDKTKVGTIFEAEITRLVENAAFIELAPGLDARLHISAISNERVESIRNALRIGQSVEVMTVTSDRDRRRVDVSIKAVEDARLAEQPRAYADDSSFGGLADALRESGIVKE